MGLNSEIDNEYGPVDDQGNPNLLIDTPKDDEAFDNKSVPDDSIFSGEIIKGQLPTFVAQFELEKSKAQTTSELAEVRQELVTNSGVSVEDANVIDSLTPGFISDDNPIGFFTEDRTKTRYAETLSTVNATIDKQYDELKSSISDLSSKFYDVAKKQGQDNRSRFVDGLIGINQAIVKLLMSFDRDEVEQVPFIFNNKTRWTDFLRMNFSDFGGDYVVHEGAPSTHGFEGTLLDKYIKRYCVVFRNRDNRNNFDSIINGQGQHVSISGRKYLIGEDTISEITSEIGDTPCTGPDTLGAFMKALGNNTVRNYVNNLVNIYNVSLSVFADAQTKIKEIDGTDAIQQAKLEALLQLSGEIYDAQHRVVGVLDALAGIFQFTAITTEMIEELASTQN